jgi:hypothetical protein
VKHFFQMVKFIFLFIIKYARKTTHTRCPMCKRQSPCSDVKNLTVNYQLVSDLNEDSIGGGGGGGGGSGGGGGASSLSSSVYSSSDKVRVHAHIAKNLTVARRGSLKRHDAGFN